jgi:beta-glucanase (GH16 family)
VGWKTYGANTFNQSGAPVRTGNNYFKVYQAFTGAVNYSGIYQDYISGPGATYVADGWAYTASGDALAGQNAAWIEVTFRDANGTILALYRSKLITTNAINSGEFAKSIWINLPITNQYDPNTYVVTNTVSELVAPAGTYLLRYQVLFQGDAAYSGGSVYFDDLNLNVTSASTFGDWNIVWSDEFNGPTVNSSVWTYDIGNNSGWGNSELEYYTSRLTNAYVSNGLLHIVARKESTNGFSFTSARMKTQGLMSWKYGRFAWRAKFPVGTGFWPALWMLGTNITTVGWPGCGEIDVFESNGSTPAVVQGSLHSGGDVTGLYTFLDGSNVADFHTYVLDWTPNAFMWYVDGHLYETQSYWSSSVGSYPAPFDKPEFIIMNLAVGGSYVGYPSVATINANGGFPGDMQVDYLRVYNQTPPLKSSLTWSNGNLVLSWPSNIVAHVQAQFGSVGTNWTDLSQKTTPFVIAATNVAAFYRIVSP